MNPQDYGKWTLYYTSFVSDLTMYNSKQNWVSGHHEMPTKHKLFEHGKPWPPPDPPLILPELHTFPHPLPTRHFCSAAGYGSYRNTPGFKKYSMNPEDYGKWTLSHPIASLLYIGNPKREEGHIDLPDTNYLWLEGKKIVKEKLGGVEKWLDVKYQKQYEKPEKNQVETISDMFGL